MCAAAAAAALCRGVDVGSYMFAIMGFFGRCVDMPENFGVVMRFE